MLSQARASLLLPNRVIMQRRSARILAVPVIAAALIVTTSTPATAGGPSAEEGKVTRNSTLCRNQDGFITIGGNIRVTEFGKRGVTKLRVKWLLYNTDLSGPGLHVAYKRKTQESPQFPNDHRNYYHDFGKRWENMVAPDAGFTLVAKATWVRPNKPDWNKKYTVAYCS